jgi:hypothetical protein
MTEDQERYFEKFKDGFTTHTVSEAEWANLRRWKSEHNPTCPHELALIEAKETKDWSSEKFSSFPNQGFSFFFASIGTKVEYHCACGEMIDITDYSSW